MKVGVIGAGSMGTALSQVIDSSNDILLYARRQNICNDININGYNSEYFPNIKLNDNIFAVNKLNELSDVKVVFLCIPSSILK